MGTEKRARQKAGRQARIEAAITSQQRAARRARIIQGVIVVVVALGLIAAVAFFRRDSGTTVDTTASSTPITSAPPGATTLDSNGVPVSPDQTSSTAGVPAGASITGQTPCPPADGSAQRTTTFENPPPMCIDVNKTYTAKVATTKGDFTITLDPKSAPLAANNFVTLARYHYYDGTTFHRVIPDFVVQGGDATGNPPGTGGPGYKFKDELPKDATVYQPGVVAMANSGPDTNGSQFYIVLQPDKLQASYSVFGNVTQGFDTTVKAIEKGGSPSGTPTDPATITSVTITEN